MAIKPEDENWIDKATKMLGLGMQIEQVKAESRQQAMVIRAVFDSYVRVGFTEEQAMQLLLKQIPDQVRSIE